MSDDRPRQCRAAAPIDLPEVDEAPTRLSCPTARNGVPAVLAIALAAVGVGAQAQPPSPAGSDGADDWHLRLAIPIWLPGTSGTLTVLGHELTPSEDPGDINLFASHVSFAATLHAEAEKDRFGLFMDSMYLDVRAEPTGPFGLPAEASEKAFIGELGGFYTLQAPQPHATGWGTFRADVLGGVRVTWLELGMETTVFSGTSAHTVVDPIVGARMQLGITDWLDYKLRGDVGGFGLSPGTTSTFAWNIDTGVEFHLSRLIDLDLGYRWLDYDFSWGPDSNPTGLDARLDGPYLTLQFSFTF